MKYFTKKILSILPFIIVLLYSGMVFAEEKTEPRLITVTGKAEVRVVPDEIILVLGVETQDKDLNVAKNENDRRTGEIFKIAEKYKIEQKHVQTGYINIEPRYDNGYERERFIGYFVKKSVVLTLKDTSQFESLLGDVLKAGANYVHGIQFRTTELRKYRDKARSLAIKAAQEKANMLARELEQKVGRPYSINENPSESWSGYNTRWGGGMAQNVMQEVAGTSQPDGGIALGQIEINAEVTVSFELEEE